MEVICTNQVLCTYDVLNTVLTYYFKEHLIISRYNLEILLGHCTRKYEGGCLNSKDLLLKIHKGEFTLHGCYQLCLALAGCDGFFISKDGTKCALFKKGCQRKIDSPPRWDYYEMKDCPGIVECL